MWKVADSALPAFKGKRWAFLLSALAMLAFAGALAAIVHVANGEHEEPLRCPPGLIALEARCCGRGQNLRNGRCSGTPARCGAGMHGVGGRHGGCVANERRVSFTGGVLRIAQSDWEPQGEVQPRAVRVAPFELDSHEVTFERWQSCVVAGGCRKIETGEPGQPVTRISPAEALRFCRFYGGRLPTSEEWMFAAAGPMGRRFPWGSTGLVCRRAAFGLVEGPCATGLSGPEIAGARPDGKTLDGVFDLSGNVAEWTLESKSNRERPEFAARGGSYRSRVASELKSWAVESTDEPAPHIGFRCAYGSD